MMRSVKQLLDDCGHRCVNAYKNVSPINYLNARTLHCQQRSDERVSQQHTDTSDTSSVSENEVETASSMNAIIHSHEYYRKMYLKGLKNERNNLLYDILRLRAKIERSNTNDGNNSEFVSDEQTSQQCSESREQLNRIYDVKDLRHKENKFARISAQIESLIANNHTHPNLINNVIYKYLLDSGSSDKQKD